MGTAGSQPAPVNGPRGWPSLRAAPCSGHLLWQLPAIHPLPSPRGTERGRDELGVPSAPLVQRGEGRQVSQSDGDRAVVAMQTGINADGPVQ